MFRYLIFSSLLFQLLSCGTYGDVHAQDSRQGMPREDVVDVPAIGEGLCVSNVFQTNMVLQRDKPMSLWGWADAGREGHRDLRRQATSGHRRRRPIVEGHLCPPWPPVPIRSTLTVKGATKTLTLDNILVGDVWVLGGQSNMEFPLQQDRERRTRNRLGQLPEHQDPDHPGSRTDPNTERGSRACTNGAAGSAAITARATGMFAHRKSCVNCPPSDTSLPGASTWPARSRSASSMPRAAEPPWKPGRPTRCSGKSTRSRSKPCLPSGTRKFRQWDPQADLEGRIEQLPPEGGAAEEGGQGNSRERAASRPTCDRVRPWIRTGRATAMPA